MFEDELHNFTDGLSIEAAFNESQESVSVGEEFLHELGD